MKIRYNAPVTLTFTFLAAGVLLGDKLTNGFLTQTIFSIPGRGIFSFANPFDYLRLFTHVLGHANLAHLLGNFSFILLLGPILEEKYSGLGLLGMILITALATGLVHVFLEPSYLLGASGIVFMMILLISFTNMRDGSIPLTFILIFLLYITKELISALDQNSISELAHVIGGICGSLFGFIGGKPKEE